MPRRPPSRCPRCRGLTDSSGLCPDCRRGPDNRAQWKWVYKDPRWQAIRDQVLSEEPVCACGCGGVPTVVDHITPHRGDEQLAFDRNNCQAMTRRCHDAKTAAETLNAPGRGTVTFVLGPPCSGKTSYAHTAADPDRDVVIDLDALAEALTPHPTKAPHAAPQEPRAKTPTLNRPPRHHAHPPRPRTTTPTDVPPTHGHPQHLVALANEARDALLRRLTRPHTAAHVWIVTTRHADTARVPGARVVRMDTDAAECKRRARAAGRPEHWDELIDEWFIIDRTRR